MWDQSTGFYWGEQVRTVLLELTLDIDQAEAESHWLGVPHSELPHLECRRVESFGPRRWKLTYLEARNLWLRSVN